MLLSKIVKYTLEVVALYPSISVEMALKAMENAFSRDTTCDTATKSVLTRFCEFILNQSFIVFEERGYVGKFMGMTLSKAYETFFSANPELTFSQLSKAMYRNVIRENVRTNQGMTQLYKAAKREVCCMISNTEQFKLL